MAQAKTRATGWIGSKYVGIPAATGQKAGPPAAPGYRAALGTTGPNGEYIPPTPALTDFGGGDPEQQQRQIQDAINAGAPLGFEAGKWADPTWNTNKYLAGRTLAAGGSIANILASPQYAGWSQVGDDKIKSPDGNVYDLIYDVGGPNQRFQYTQVAGPGLDRNGIPGVNSAGVRTADYAALQNNGIRGDYAAAIAGGGGNAPGSATGSASGWSGRAGADTPYQYDPFNAPAPFDYAAFAPPTDVTDANDPGYTARLREGQQALQRSAAAKGTLLTGGTLKDLNQASQDYAANEYQNVYNRALQTYGTQRQNAFENYGTNFQNALNAYKTNFDTSFQPWQANANEAYRQWMANYTKGQQQWENQFNTENQKFGQLYQTTALGQNATNQAAQIGAQYNDAYMRYLGQYGQQGSELLTNQGNADAAAQAQSGTAWNNALGNISNSALGGYYMSQYGGQNPAMANIWGGSNQWPKVKPYGTDTNPLG